MGNVKAEPARPLSVPTFILVGKYYECRVAGRSEHQVYLVKKVDSDGGWIQADWQVYDPAYPRMGSNGTYWFNLTHFQSCNEVSGFGRPTK